jgi:hypothetical protein
LKTDPVAKTYKLLLDSGDKKCAACLKWWEEKSSLVGFSHPPPAKAVEGRPKVPGERQDESDKGEDE